MKKAKWLCTAAAVLALSVAVAGCGGSDDKKAADSKGGPKGDVMVYTSIYPDIIDKMCKPNVAKAFPDTCTYPSQQKKIMQVITLQSRRLYLIKQKKKIFLH